MHAPHRIHIDLNRFVREHFEKRYVFLYLLAVLVGIIAGIGAVIFRLMISGALSLSFKQSFDRDAGLNFIPIPPMGGFLLFILMPALGGLIVGTITTRWASEAKGHGVPELMAAVAERKGRIRGRVALVKSIASALTIGTGGSAGAEGPIALIGAGAGSQVGQRTGLHQRDVNVLLACGASAGIAAVFNAPLGGVIFALELILLEFKTRSFIPLVISTVVAVAMANILVPEGRIYSADISLLNGLSNAHDQTGAFITEMVMFALLGLLAGIVAVSFIHLLRSSEDYFDGIDWIRPELKPALGGLGMGVMGVILYGLYHQFHLNGPGNASVNAVLAQDWGVFGDGVLIIAGLLLLLMVMKILATSLTLGTGGSGGVFSPSLFIGAMLGGAFGLVLQNFGIGNTSPAIYAIVGMGAVFAGASRAALATMFIIFEMTGDYRIMLPLMFACVISDGMAKALYPESIYTFKLRRLGVHFSLEKEVCVLDLMTARDIMGTDVDTVRDTDTIQMVYDRLFETGRSGFPVMDGDDRLVGIISHDDLMKAISEQDRDAPVTDYCSTGLLVGHPEEILNDIVKKFDMSMYKRIPIVDVNDESKLLGIITRRDIIRAYRMKILEIEEC